MSHSALSVRSTATAVLLLAAGVVAPAQVRPAPVTFAVLREAPQNPGPSREWTVELPAAAAGELAQLQPPQFRVLRIAKVPERDPQISDDSLVVVAVDAAGATLDWQIIADPRVIRAESPDADGLLSGQRLVARTAEVRAVLNGGDRTARILVYTPQWDGSEWQLQPAAMASVVR